MQNQLPIVRCSAVATFFEYLHTSSAYMHAAQTLQTSGARSMNGRNKCALSTSPSYHTHPGIRNIYDTNFLQASRRTGFSRLHAILSMGTWLRPHANRLCSLQPNNMAASMFGPSSSPYSCYFRGLQTYVAVPRFADDSMRQCSGSSGPSPKPGKAQRRCFRHA
jgi:hypothetical protein